MIYNQDILQFQFGDFKAIGMNHFEQRRAVRTRAIKTDLFSRKKLSDDEALIECFKILERDKYEEIQQAVRNHHPKRVEFVAGFQTDEVAENGRDSVYFFVVLSISDKRTPKGKILAGEKFLSCITVVKDTHKKRCRVKKDIVEIRMCYCKDEEGKFVWRNFVPRI